MTQSPGMTGWLEERGRLEGELGERITLDALTGPNGSESRGLKDDAGGEAGWLIAQRKVGHRHSIDDVLTAWYALQVSPPVREHLDLGTGIGTVGLLTLWGMGPEARLTCVEAQEISYRLLQSNLEANGLRSRVDCSHGDLRDLALERTFPLITGSPPYFPEGTGVIPKDSQKAHARFELRGDVSDYARAAVRHLSADGWFVLCFPTPQKQRALDGIAAAGSHAQIHVDESVVALAVGHGVMRSGIGQHAGAAGGKDLFAGFVLHLTHGVGQRAAQGGHARSGVEVGGVEDDKVRHGVGVTGGC
jgi:tRNA1(Val) A37 N6-methylase TrmN6